MAYTKTINSVIRAAEILKCLSRGLNRLSDISRDLDLTKSTTYRLLSTLEKSGLVMQDPIRHRYYLGHLILSLSADPLLAHQNLVVCAAEDLESLRQVSRETVAIHLPFGNQRISVEEIPSFEAIKFTAGRGAVAPLFAGAVGKVLLSQLSQVNFDRFLENTTLIKIGNNTITDPDELRLAIKKTQQDGYATSFGERFAESACISVPIKNYIQPVALSVLGPDKRIASHQDTLLIEMKAAAERITGKIDKILAHRQ